MIKDTLRFKYTTSRGRDTYGYNICSLYVNGRKAYSCNGGGYDMKGTVFANYIQNNYQEQLLKLHSAEYYGMWFYKNNGSGVERVDSYEESNKTGAYLDGGCGFDSMKKILVACGGHMEFIHSDKHGDEVIYLVTTN